MKLSTVKWVSVGATLTLMGVAGLLGHVVLAQELAPWSYLSLLTAAAALGLAIGYTASEVSHRHRYEIERHNAELSALNAVAVTASRSLELPAVLHDCLAKTLEVMKLEGGAIFVFSGSGTPTMAAHRGLSEAQIKELAGLRIEGEARTSVSIPEASGTEGEAPAEKRGSHPRASICVALRSEGRGVGAMHLFSATSRTFSDRDVQILVSIADVIGMAVQNAKLHGQVREHAIRDPLTGLYNRRYFDQIYPQEVERARRYGTPLTVAMVDIDDFKQINDRFGHKMGDEVLVAIAAILREGRASDVAVRYGGDEFLVMMPNTDLRGARAVSERIRRTARSTILPGLLDGGIAVSVGLADSSRGYDQILERADARMYLEKRRGQFTGGS